jgi:hypothetical protein
MKTVFCILIVMFIIGCKKEKTEIPPFINKGLNVHYSEGSGWTGWEYGLNIDSTGLMTVYEIKHLPKISERNKRCTLLAEEVDSLKYEIENLSAIKLQDYGFGPDKPTDLPVSIFRYNLNTSSDSSSIYYPKEGEMPAEFVKVLGRIYKLRNKYDRK